MTSSLGKEMSGFPHEVGPLLGNPFHESFKCPDGYGSKIGVQSGTLVFGILAVPQWFYFDPYPDGCGSKLNRRGYAGFGPCFHLLGFHLGYLFLTPTARGCPETA